MAVVRDIRNKLFEKSMRLPLAYHTNERKGDLMSRMVSDVNEIEIAVVCLLELLFREPFAVLINIATLIYLSPSLSLFSFLLMPISAFVISKIGKSLKRTAKKSQEQTSVMYSSMDEGIEGVRIIKAFNAAAFIVSGFRKTNLKHQKLVTRTARKKNLSPLLNETIGAASPRHYQRGKMTKAADLGLESENTVFGQLERSTADAILKGSDMKLKSIADKKMILADLQSALNDTFE